MSTFDLSLAAKPAAMSTVKASEQYSKVKDPKTGDMEKQTITDSAVTIDKSAAPKLKLDGPLGYMYTELLNKELSLESMGAIVAAADSAIDAALVDDGSTPGMVAVVNGQARIEQPDNQEGYVYVMSADTMESQALGEISAKMIEHRLKAPKAQLGLIALSEGKPSASLESLVKCLTPLGVKVAMTKDSGAEMIQSYLKG